MQPIVRRLGMTKTRSQRKKAGTCVMRWMVDGTANIVTERGEMDHGGYRCPMDGARHRWACIGGRDQSQMSTDQHQTGQTHANQASDDTGKDRGNYVCRIRRPTDQETAGRTRHDAGRCCERLRYIEGVFVGVRERQAEHWILQAVSVGTSVETNNGLVRQRVGLVRRTTVIQHVA